MLRRALCAQGSGRCLRRRSVGVAVLGTSGLMESHRCLVRRRIVAASPHLLVVVDERRTRVYLFDGPSDATPRNWRFRGNGGWYTVFACTLLVVDQLRALAACRCDYFVDWTFSLLEALVMIRIRCANGHMFPACRHSCLDWEIFRSVMRLAEPRH